MASRILTPKGVDRARQIAVSDTTLTENRIHFVAGTNITLGVTSNSIQFDGASGGTGGGSFSAGISGGNTSGDTGTIANGRIIFAGGNNVTLSGSTDGSSMSITISAGAGGAGMSGGISGGNTSGDTGTVTGRMVFAGGNNVTLSGSTNAGSITITVSAASQTVQTQGGFASIGISGGNTDGDTGADTRARLVFAGGNLITLSGSTNGASHTISIVGTQSVQTQGGFAAMGVSTGGSTSGDTGVATRARVVFAGIGNLTLSASTDAGSMTISISGGTAGAGFAGGGISGGNTSGDTGSVTGRLIFAGGNNVTLSGSTNAGSMTISISAFTQTVQTQGGFASMGISGGNTAGDTGASTLTRMVFAGGNKITVSGSTAAGAYSISISAADQTVQTQGIPILGISGGNTAGDTGAASGTKLVFAGGANITLSGSTAANATTISVVGATAGGGGGITGVMSNLGNTSGDTGTIEAKRLILVGGENITLSGSTNGSSQTITISGQPYRRMWNNVLGDVTASWAPGNSTSFMNAVMLPFPVQVDFARFYFTVATTSGAPFATTANSTFTAEARQTFRIDIYTRGVGGSSMSLQRVTSGSAGLTEQWSVAEGANSAAMTASYRITYPFRTGTSSYSTSATVNSASWQVSAKTATWWGLHSGSVMMDIPFAGGNASINEGPIWVMYGVSTERAQQVANASALGNNSIQYRPLALKSPFLGMHLPYAATNSSVMYFPGHGSFSTVGGATTASIPFSVISSSVTFPTQIMAFMADVDA